MDLGAQGSKSADRLSASAGKHAAASRTQERHPLAALSGNISAAIFLAVIALAPLPYGSRDAATVAFWCVVLGIGLITSPWQEIRRPHLLLSLGIVLLLAALGFVLHEHLSSAPWIAAPHPVWAQASSALGTSLSPRVSLVRNEPYFAIGNMLAGMLALWLGLILGADRHRARRALRTVAISGALYAVFGILSTLIAPTMLIFMERVSFVGNVTGTFVNRNTAAAYFGFCTVIWLLFFLERARQLLPHGFARGLRMHLVSELMQRRDILTLCGGLFICLVALFMTGSRAGIVLSLAVIAIAITIYVGLDRRERGRIFVLFAMACAIVLSLYFFLGGSLDARFEMNGLADGGRTATYRGALALIADRPWFGSGLGTFDWAFPAFRNADTSLWGIWNIAHSTPLELATDLGLPMATVIGLAWIAALTILMRGTVTRRRDAIIPLAALSTALIGLFHSAVDFSFQVPGFAIVAMGVTGTGLAQAFASASRMTSANDARDSAPQV